MTTPLLRRTAVALTAVATLATGLTSTASARTDEPLGGSRTDAAGDVLVTTGDPLTQADLDRIDLTSVSWTRAPGRKITFRLRLVDITGGPLRTFYGVKARAGGSTVFVQATRSAVKVIDGDRVTRCRGAKSSVDAERDRVRFTVPVSCLAYDRYNFAPIAFLQSAAGDEDLATDRVRRTGLLSIG